jgi:hypothetical protein
LNDSYTRSLIASDALSTLENIKKLLILDDQEETNNEAQ